MTTWFPYYLKFCDQSRTVHALRNNHTAYCGFTPKRGWMGGERSKFPPPNACSKCSAAKKDLIEA